MKRTILCTVLFLSVTALLATEAERQAFTQEGPEFQEITIHIRANKAVTEALLDAVDKGSTVIEVADFDSLSAVFGLMGIYREDAMSSGFFGHRFRLRFLSDRKVTAIAEAYRTSVVIKSANARRRVYSSHGISSTCAPAAGSPESRPTLPRPQVARYSMLSWPLQRKCNR